MKEKVIKAILLPVNKDNKVLIQDRENHKPPRWGFFGGTVEEGESVIEGLIRETKEELCVELKESDVEKLGIFIEEKHYEKIVEMHVFVFRTDLGVDDFKVEEGKGAEYMDFDKAKEFMNEFASPKDVEVIESLVGFVQSK